ncbi:hypothetical protein MJO28_007945 [Puccinia striiformis f. sp. tritici]|uniref:Exoribonuclease phosphorolytic domain-containing protein n=2 Tax=Puccinia striiformis TaxID=27350 RepID=A0A2S4VAM5_9BASI|nr:hypothetical protein Pst134EA_015985 [Puccinia striiformis f. sp. tritici]KAH9463905.1 hypothetical protein Pst134EA_015985 [Puccinia striiformis f. sp. tritici]KAI7949124.1 hypothetical protein MJO28_007945 [Puccinia striiformis f. sp. tritici]POW06602.1 hypothetical protein PSTT_08851 [Puccinia striiformis]
MASTLSLKNLQAAALQAGSTNNNNTTIDRRRFVGPDSSTPFLDFPSTSTTQPLAKTTDRADGRANHDSRPICIKVGVIAQANGSCYIESGNSKVICAVYGPKPRLSQPNFPSVTPLAITLRFAPFCMAAGRMIPTALGGIETTVSQLTHQALMPSLLPMSESSIVEVHITVLEWDGPLSPGPCVLASSVALASAGIPTLGLVIPTTLALSRELHLLDPTSTEAESASAIFDLASIPAMGTVTHVGLRSTTDWKSAPIEFNTFDHCLETCKSNAELIHGLAATALQEHLSSDS